ncbi:hypothetical protein [Streptomyces griseofuscus]|uniref:hypothetical protein n=1 Tax=Streptomyces griseofuscus TaxID=146922 RepID=UPI00367CB704
MPHTSRPRQIRRMKSARLKRASFEAALNNRSYDVVFVWGAGDMAARCMAVADEDKALQRAMDLADRGAKIVLVKKNTPNDGAKLIADFSTVRGAA